MAETISLRGTFVAIATPFKSVEPGAGHGDAPPVDEARLFALAAFLKANGVNGIVACGTTGEGATLTPEETVLATRTVRDAVGPGYPVIMGAGSNDTVRAVAMTRLAAGAGADAVLSVTPYYNKPTQEGLYRHFIEVAEASDLPVVLYNVPGRTGVSISPKTVGRLSAHPRIAGLKEAAPDMRRVIETRALVPEGFSILSGDDPTVVPCIACGGNGVISVAAGVIPRRFSTMVDAALAGDLKAAGAEQAAILELIDALFLESNPIPVKTSLAMMGLIEETFRLPLVPMERATRAKLAQVLAGYGLLPGSTAPAAKA